MDFPALKNYGDFGWILFFIVAEINCCDVQCTFPTIIGTGKRVKATFCTIEEKKKQEENNITRQIRKVNCNLHGIETKHHSQKCINRKVAKLFAALSLSLSLCVSGFLCCCCWLSHRLSWSQNQWERFSFSLPSFCYFIVFRKFFRMHSTWFCIYLLRMIEFKQMQRQWK